MISGRGLGHTGGTLDKLEAIPGFRSDFTSADFVELLRKSGVAIISQSPELVPADKKMYALRDVTATVDCIPLIVASIISKKVAEGTDAIVFDVKVGRGAFMKNESDGRRLAESLVSTARDMGRDASALLTRMDCPIGREVGNLNETLECFELLKGSGSADLLELVLALGTEMLMLSARWNDRAAARRELEDAIEGGRALQKFEEFVHLQGGDIGFLRKGFDAPYSAEVISPQDGFLIDVDALPVGMAVVSLGAGRSEVGEEVDPLAGLSIKKALGEEVKKDEILATVSSSRAEIPPHVIDRVSAAFVIGDAATKARPIVLDAIV
jgi:pyrimidine-nucleoside phosphorylase